VTRRTSGPGSRGKSEVTSQMGPQGRCPLAHRNWLDKRAEAGGPLRPRGSERPGPDRARKAFARGAKIFPVFAQKRRMPPHPKCPSTCGRIVI